MLPGTEARGTDHSGEAISQDYRRFVVVVPMRDYGSEREALDGVAGRKPIAAVEEVGASASFHGPLAASGGFENFGHNQTVHERFGSQ
jgi:hypothetical protein